MQWISDSINSLFGSSEPEDGTNTLQKSGNLTKDQIYKFFEAGYQMFDDEDVKMQLKTAYVKGQSIDWVVAQLQKKIFENQGIDGNYGLNFLAKIRTTYGDDPEIMQNLMKFVEREDLALSEAELPLDEFMEKLEMKNWAREQMSNIQDHIKQMTPMQQQQFLSQQQQMYKTITEEKKSIMEKAENMGIEEKKKFVKEQIKKLQDKFTIENTNLECSDNSCQHHHDLNMNDEEHPVNFGSSMTKEEQANFFKSLHNIKKLD